jgi:hypothetical protein
MSASCSRKRTGKAESRSSGCGLSPCCSPYPRDTPSAAVRSQVAVFDATAVTLMTLCFELLATPFAQITVDHRPDSLAFEGPLSHNDMPPKVCSQILI